MIQLNTSNYNPMVNQYENSNASVCNAYQNLYAFYRITKFCFGEILHKAGYTKKKQKKKTLRTHTHNLIQNKPFFDSP